MNILHLNNVLNVGGVTKCILQLTEDDNNENKMFVAAYENKLPKATLKVPFYKLKKMQLKSIYNIVPNIFILIKIIKKHNIDILHSHHRMTTLLAKIVSKIVKIKVVHTAHAINNDKKFVGKAVLKNIQVISVSNGVKKNLIEKYHLNSSSICTIYNSIKLSNSNADVDERLITAKKNNFFIVGTVSRLEKGKGINFFLEAAKILISFNYRIKFIVVGDGSLMQEYKEFITNNYLQDDIYLVGQQENVQIYLDYFDVFVQPSESEGLGLSAIESISKGTPVIASDILGLNEVVINEYNGLLFNCGDIGALVSAIEILLNDNEKLRFLSENSMRYFLDNFQLDRFKGKHIEVYRRVLNE